MHLEFRKTDSYNDPYRIHTFKLHLKNFKKLIWIKPLMKLLKKMLIMRKIVNKKLNSLHP